MHILVAIVVLLTLTYEWAFARVSESGLSPVRYSLRTLLIATTLIAVLLGLIVALLRWPAG
jgi:hypothetical protein